MPVTESRGILRDRGTGGSPADEEIDQFGDRRQHIDQAEARHRPFHECVTEKRFEPGDEAGKVVPFPERGPGNQNQQQSRFEQQGDQ